MVMTVQSVCGTSRLRLTDLRAKQAKPSMLGRPRSPILGIRIRQLFSGVHLDPVGRWVATHTIVHPHRTHRTFPPRPAHSGSYPSSSH